MALFRGIQEYIALDAHNIARVEGTSCTPLKAIHYYMIIVWSTLQMPLYLYT